MDAMAGFLTSGTTEEQDIILNAWMIKHIIL